MIENILLVLVCIALGFLSGYLFVYFHQRKSELLYIITTMREDVINLTARLEKFFESADRRDFTKE